MNQWTRRFANSATNFDLCLANPQRFDVPGARNLLRTVLEQKHRNLTLSTRAEMEFQRWFQDPDTPLKSDAYVLLSNWFLTQSGDRHSSVATHCENLWDALFPCRPPSRLSSPEPGRNHVMVPAAFDRFWQRIVGIQDGSSTERMRSLIVQAGKNEQPAESDANGNLAGDSLRAKFTKDGLHFEIEGPSQALADFLRRVSSWNTEHGESQ